MTKQEAGRKKRESKKKEELDARSGQGNLAQDALAAQADIRNKAKKDQEDAAKQFRKNVKAFTTDNKRKPGTAKDPKQQQKKCESYFIYATVYSPSSTGGKDRQRT